MEVIIFQTSYSIKESSRKNSLEEHQKNHCVNLSKTADVAHIFYGYGINRIQKKNIIKYLS